MQVYIVYFGEHSGEKTLQEIEENHQSYLSSVKETNEEEDRKSSLLYSYKHTINGFAALLTAHEASQLSSQRIPLSLPLYACHVCVIFMCWIMFFFFWIKQKRWKWCRYSEAIRQNTQCTWRGRGNSPESKRRRIRKIVWRRKTSGWDQDTEKMLSLAC